eukprot:m.259521 g.259521  ORF g.259521 m.259521 type:complete len:339 (-) comp38205_c0_seq1:83-1099(-)
MDPESTSSNMPSLTKPLLDDGDEDQNLLLSQIGEDYDDDTEVTEKKEEDTRPLWRVYLPFVVVFVILSLFFGILGIASANVTERDGCESCPVVGTTASNVAQLLLPFVYLGALLTSWYCESPRRTLKQFVIDNLKQVISGACTHFEATGVAVIFNELIGDIEECDWYLVLFMMDTAYGCFLTISVHALTVKWAAHFKWSEPLSRLGDYKPKQSADGSRKATTTRSQIGIWAAQTFHWTIIAVLMRGVVMLIVWLFHPSLGKTAVMLGKWACTKAQVRAKTFLNIVFFPCIFDAVQVTAQSFALKPSKDVIKQQRERTDFKKQAIDKADTSNAGQRVNL